MPAPFTLHRPTEDDWAAIRDLRLRMVTDTPVAFLETSEQVLAHGEQHWRERGRRNSTGPGTYVVAVDPDGRWIGSMVGMVSDGSPGYVATPRAGRRRANLVGVFVDPQWRGAAGVTDTLLGEVCRWAAQSGFDLLYLHVSEQNPRAIRAYEKRGFVRTGVLDRIPGREHDREIEMVLTLPVESP
jgi:RimJ/RimL family protein N-acetyltransferase